MKSSFQFSQLLECLSLRFVALSISLLNEGKSEDCFSILCCIEKVTSVCDCANLRVFLFNNFGCYYRRALNFQIALSYLYQAQKLVLSSGQRQYHGLTLMNISALLSQLKEFAYC